MHSSHLYLMVLNHILPLRVSHNYISSLGQSTLFSIFIF